MAARLALLVSSRRSLPTLQPLPPPRALSRIASLLVTSLLAVSFLSFASNASPLRDASPLPDASPFPDASPLPDVPYDQQQPIPEPLASLQSWQSLQNVSSPSSAVPPASRLIGAAGTAHLPAATLLGADGTAVLPASKLIGADGTPGKVFSWGSYKVVQRSSIGGPMFVFKVLPPRPLLLWAPATSSPQSFPVVLFQHGWATHNYWFGDMLKRVVSHGYIVVAPQMYPLIGLTGAIYEMKGSCAVIRWLKDNLKDWLARHPILHRRTKASPDWSKFALTGHSRGGKVAFGVLRELFCKSAVAIKAQFLLDPVNGGGERSSFKSGDSVLTYVPNSIQVSAPVAVLGTGLGGSCAPEGDNYKEFYSDMVGPVWKFVVPGYGHADFFNNWIGPGITFISKHFCKNGPARKPMRVVTGGLMVAFLQAKLLGDSADLDDLMANPGHSPVPISQPVTKP
ncbi:hypothetical protein CLOM_g2202 [Closterium sp. NIES-68]|nr:hypothetical protein CLOM_g2202 [Closterium sp. NIES-68]GJP68820.1 hypothetical protein CLOP_g25474 [Closterium sp. NIES-67]